ncbi:MAG: penicillin-binding protein [Actinomycetota bacterium]|nr:penicillin-binding protein [Actinomycetota bacterium]
MASSSRDPHPWPTIGKLFGALVATGILAAGLLLPYIGGLGLAARHEAAKFLDTSCNLQETQPPQASTIYANDGTTVIARIFTQDRQPVALSQVPPSLVQALVATEDRRFYSHHGVDMRGLLRSAVSNAGGSTQGGSTLTMQYVKEIRYYQAGKDVAKQQAAIDQNLNRKIEDAKCALYIENTEHESKDTILDNYLNIAFFGENSYGIQTAAQTYFNKTVDKLTLPESALLVGLLRAPSQYDPFVNSDAAKSRRNEVLQNLVAVHDISQAEATAAEAEPVHLATKSAPLVREGCPNATTQIANVGFFCDYVTAWLRNTQGITDLDTGGYKIITTLSPALQNSGQAHLLAAFPSSAQMTAVLPAVDPRTGNVLAMISNKLYGDTTTPSDITHTVLPNFTSYTASGASTYKLFSLLTALQIGVPDTWTLGAAPATANYTPTNCSSTTPATNGDANESYAPNETLQSATVKSSNTFFVGMDDTLFQCNLQPIVDMALSLGMNGLKQPVDSTGKATVGQEIVRNQYVLPIALGSGLATSPLELAGAYATVANGGMFNAPAPVVSITDQSGATQPVKRAPGVRVLSPQVAAQAETILAGDTTAPGTSYTPFQDWYSANSSVVAGKTGTAVDSTGHKNSSLWFVGMTPTLVATAAVINPSGPSNPIVSLPGAVDPATQAYGDYASGLWLKAFMPTLVGQHWSWPPPSSPSFGVAVPPVVGMSVKDAQATLTAAGFTMVQFDAADHTLCASAVPANQIAYAGPSIAPKGSTITVCPSSGIPEPTYTPPVVRIAPPSRTPGGPGATGGRTVPGGAGGATPGSTPAGPGQPTVGPPSN